MRFLELLLGISVKLLDRLPLSSVTAKRTLCCNVQMWDVWIHTKDCPNYSAAYARVKANGGRDVPPTYGDTRGVCPTCGFPTGHYGIYTVGEPCSWCGYVEKRH
jgi:hypothetical protein